MTTPSQDLQSIITGYIEPSWPGSNSVVGYYDASDMTLEAVTSLPSPTDYILFWVIKTVLETRTHDESFDDDMTNAERKDLYQDVSARLTKGYDQLGAALTLLDTFTATLP